jgi:hypothetical protein
MQLLNCGEANFSLSPMERHGMNRLQAVLSSLARNLKKRDFSSHLVNRSAH